MSKYLAPILSLCALGFLAAPASAAIVCNTDGDCWRVKRHYDYKPEYGLKVYGDDWKWGPNEKYRWREAHHGRGYWRKGVWITF